MPVTIKRDAILSYEYDDSPDWKYAIVVDEEGNVSPRFYWGDGCPADEWHGRTLTIVKVPPGAADVSGLVDALEERRADLEHVHEGHSVEWDGSNFGGRLSDSAAQVFAQVRQEMEDEQISTYWEAAAFYDGNLDKDDWKAVFGTSEEKRAHAKETASEASSDIHVSVDDLVEYYEKLKMRASEAIGINAEAAVTLLLNGETVWVSYADESIVASDDEPDDCWEASLHDIV